MADEEIIRSLGGIICDCSPERNNHLPTPLGPAGMCPFCNTFGPFYQDALKHYEVTHNGMSPHKEVSATTFKRVPLSGLLSEGVPVPQIIGSGFLYAGGLHSIAGAPDSGKTTIAMHWALELLSAGQNVLFFDEEGGQEIVTEKFAALGAKPVDLESLTYVPFPGRTWDEGDIEDLFDLARDVRPQMMIWDSSAAFLARAGLDENHAPDVTNWWSRVLTPVARELNVAMLVIDHDTKGSEQSRYARGSGAKLAAIDVQFKVEMITAFSRTQAGELKVRITKDRRGYLYRDWRVRVETGEGRIDPSFTREGSSITGEAWPPAKRKIFGVLSSDHKSIRDIEDALALNFPAEQPHTRETISRHLNELLEEGKAGRIGANNLHKWRRA